MKKMDQTHCKNQGEEPTEEQRGATVLRTNNALNFQNQKFSTTDTMIRIEGKSDSAEVGAKGNLGQTTVVEEADEEDVGDRSRGNDLTKPRKFEAIVGFESKVSRQPPPAKATATSLILPSPRVRDIYTALNDAK